MNTRERAEEWCDAISVHRLNEHETEGRLIIRDLLAELDLYQGLLKAEQEDCENQRVNKVANWEKYQLLLAECERLENKHLEKGFPYQSLKQTVAEQAEKIERLKDELTYEVKDWKRIYELRIQEAIESTKVLMTQSAIAANEVPVDLAIRQTAEGCIEEINAEPFEDNLCDRIRAKYLK